MTISDTAAMLVTLSAIGITAVHLLTEKGVARLRGKKNVKDINRGNRSR